MHGVTQSSAPPYEIGTVIMPVLQMGKLRLGKLKQLVSISIVA